MTCGLVGVSSRVVITSRSLTVSRPMRSPFWQNLGVTACRAGPWPMVVRAPQTPAVMVLAAIVAVMVLAVSPARAAGPVGTGDRVLVRVAWRGGLGVETPATVGLHRVLAECVLPPDAPSRAALAALGAEVGVTLGRDSFGVWLEAPANAAGQALAVLGRALEAPAFAPDVVARARALAVVPRPLSAAERGRRALERLLLAGTPYAPSGRVGVGVTDAALRTAWAERYGLARAVIAAVGVDEATARRALGAPASMPAAARAPAPTLPPLAASAPLRYLTVDEGAEVARVLWGARVTGEAPALDALEALGGALPGALALYGGGAVQVATVRGVGFVILRVERVCPAAQVEACRLAVERAIALLTIVPLGVRAAPPAPRHRGAQVAAAIDAKILGRGAAPTGGLAGAAQRLGRAPHAVVVVQPFTASPGAEARVRGKKMKAPRPAPIARPRRP